MCGIAEAFLAALCSAILLSAAAVRARLNFSAVLISTVASAILGVLGDGVEKGSSERNISISSGGGVLDGVEIVSGSCSMLGRTFFGCFSRWFGFGSDSTSDCGKSCDLKGDFGV